jgi:hypothetical protein
MLTEPELRDQLTAAASRIDDDNDRAWRAITVGSRVLVRRRRARIGAAAIALIACVAATPALLDRDRPATPTTAAISCEPRRTVVNTPRVAALDDGAVVRIVNDTSSSVVVRVGTTTAVISPGVAEGQFPVTSGVQHVQCLDDGVPSQGASISVVREAHA